MAIDETAKLSNIVGSVRKFLFDNLTTIEGISVYFDQRIDIRKRENEEQWYEVVVLPNNLESLQFQEFKITPATINDSGSERLYNLRDTLLKYLSDPEKSNNDGFRTRFIPIHSITGTGSSRVAGDVVSNATISRLEQGPEKEAKDQTRFLSIDITLFLDAKL